MRRVLLVDDDEDILESVGLLLEFEGFHVTRVARAQDILREVVRSGAEVVLHDVNMPGLDVRESVRSIKALDPPTRPVVILFSAVPDVERLATEVGADRALRKPLEVSTLISALGSPGA